LAKQSDFLFDNSIDRNSFIAKCLSSGEIFTNISLTLNCANNIKLAVTASVTPLKQPEQGTIGIIIVFRNTQETLSLYNALDEKNREIIEEKNKLETIFNSLLEGTFTINTSWEITSFNRSAESITGFSVLEAIGKKYWEVFPSEDGKEDPQLRAFIADHQQELLRETTIIRKDGSRILVRINSAPLMNTSGNRIGRVVTFEDISVMKNLSNHIEERFHFKNIIGRSKPMLKVFDMMENVITTDSTVLITGQSGTGKEIIARAIHLNSDRKSEPFIAVNCTAFAETLLESELFGHEKGAFTGAIKSKPGRFELAATGTLFLDEIGDLPLSVQVKLLRVIENRQFERVGGTKNITLDARIICATHRDLEKEIKEEKFREDLYYRINVINIHLPSLYDRKDDIPTLVNYFIQKFSEKFKKEINYISSNALKVISYYKWPGNIRELENVIEHAFVVCRGETIETEHLPDKFQHLFEKLITNNVGNNNKSPLEFAEKQMIEETLNRFNGNREETADALGIDKTTLWRKMKKLGLL
ncbi:MAG: sigma 54-interacting transcriptional regulator, partial [Ignavibacteriae bacterium]|nr:sigma 54-interacting transcriptional regulator [Ignavibacteriota bacterium]